jgi:hypothetical protein
LLMTLLPWAALALAVLAVILKSGSEGEGDHSTANPFPWLVAGFVALFMAIGAGWFWRDSLKDLWPTAQGFAGGGLLVMASIAASRGRQGSWAGPAAIGVLGSALWTLFGTDVREPYQIGAIAGAGLIGWMLAGSGSSWPSRSASVMGLCLFADILGRRASGGHSDHAGSMFGLLLAIGVVLATGIPKRPENADRNRAIGILAALAVMVLGAWLLATRHFFLGNLWVLFAGGAVVGLISAWVVPEKESGSSGFTIGMILWLAAATLAFGERQGFGMAVAAVGGIATLVCLRRPRAMLTMAPLAMLIAYRTFRELHTEASRALDIGQHYALIGIVLGASLLVLAGEWLSARRGESGSTPWTAVLWIPIFFAVPFVSAVVLAAKGFIGVLAGLAFGPFVLGLKGSSRLDILSLQLGLGAAMAGGYGWLGDKVDLARDEKIKAMLWVSIGVAVLAGAIALLSKSRPEEAERKLA